jgi:hypothetical protein
MELVDMVIPSKQKDTTVIRDAIPASQRLSATLRFLATGQSFEDLKFLTAIALQDLGNIIIETCQAIITAFKDNIKVCRNLRFSRRAIALMMKAARSSETLVKFYQTTRRYNPEDSHQHEGNFIKNIFIHYNSILHRQINVE